MGTVEPREVREIGREPIVSIPDAPLPSGTSTLLAEPVRCLYVAGHHDDGSWGLAGAFWLSIDETRGGVMVAPAAARSAEVLTRIYRRDRGRGLTPIEAYEVWRAQVGISGPFMIDPQHHADSLLQVARRVELG
jgi:hypothetical protein